MQDESTGLSARFAILLWKSDPRSAGIGGYVNEEDGRIAYNRARGVRAIQA